MTIPPKTDCNNFLYLEDLKVGQQITSGKYPLDAQQIITFAQQFDPQPFHLDEEAAKQTLFGQLIASGWHTAAITMRLLVEGIGTRFAGGIIGKGGEISWPNPAYPSDVLHIECEILDIQASRHPKWGVVTIQNHTLNQEQKIVQILLADVMVLRKTSS